MNEILKEFSNLSISYNKSISKVERKINGIYFTPKKARDELFSLLPEDFKPENILEPSYGSGEFINDVKGKYPLSKIIGVEKHKDLCKSIKKDENIELYNEDFLEFENETKFDLIIGNPPYYTTKIKNSNCMKGKGNMYVLFIYKCLTEHLKENGILGFVLPTSFYNSDCYQLCRDYIRKNTKILSVKNIEVSYYETSQNTMLLVIKNQKSEDDYFFKNKYISPYYKELKDITENTTTLYELGFRVKTGEIVWNENKTKLKNKGKLVIYSSNIVENKLKIFPDGLSKEKKQYIIDCKKPSNKGKCIVISRGYGNVYKFNYAIVENEEFYGENHINIIYSIKENNEENFERIVKSFENEKTEKFIKMFIGNGALSKTEIETVLPIFLRN